MAAETNTDRTSTLKRMVAGKLSAIRERKALATPAPTAPVAVPEEVRRAAEDAAHAAGERTSLRHAQINASPSLPGEGLSREYTTMAIVQDALKAYENTLLSAPSATRPEAGEDHQPALIRMLSADHARMRKAGTALAEAALYSVREYDGLHRLSLAVAEWSKAVADEGGRAERFSPPPVSVSAPTEEGMRIFADQQSREFVEACDQAEATALSPDTDTAGREGLTQAAHDVLAERRAEGWRVAVHNDYRLSGEDWTFWLLTHPDGRYTKGEGKSDATALIRARLDRPSKAEG